MKGRYKNLKSGLIYEVEGTALNATNNISSQTVVIYERCGTKYVREITEFNAKFEEIVEPPELWTETTAVKVFNKLGYTIYKNSNGEDWWWMLNPRGSNRSRWISPDGLREHLAEIIAENDTLLTPIIRWFTNRRISVSRYDEKFHVDDEKGGDVVSGEFLIRYMFEHGVTVEQFVEMW